MVSYGQLCVVLVNFSWFLINFSVVNYFFSSIKGHVLDNFRFFLLLFLKDVFSIKFFFLQLLLEVNC